jgi:hypothetical protein
LNMTRVTRPAFSSENSANPAYSARIASLRMVNCRNHNQDGRPRGRVG